MSIYLFGEVECETVCPSFRRSRSSQDISSTLTNSDVSTLVEESRNTFLRKGAIRKRAPNTNPEKRLSVFSMPMDEYNDDLCCGEYIGRKPSLPNQVVYNKHSKNSLLFSRVMNILHSMKREYERDENKKKPVKAKNPEKKSSLVEEQVQSIVNTMNTISVTIINNMKPGNWSIESSWTDIVRGSESFSKTKCDKQAAIWELIETEASCLNFLSLIVEIFMPVFNHLQTTYHELNQFGKFELFGNVEQLYNSHIELWESCISKPLLKSRMDHEALDILFMKSGFLSISSILESYKLFMQIQYKMSKLFQELEKSNIVMREYIKWTKFYSKSYRDGILSISTNPFQRITKYKILLDRIKDFSNEDEKPHLDEMINSVHDFLDHINSIVTGDKRLEEIKSKLVETPFVKCDFINISELIEEKLIFFDITKSLANFPERVLIHDGHLKLRLNRNKGMDVHCYLFNDLFLVCTPYKKDRNKLTIYKSPIRLDKLIAKMGKENSFVALVFNDFSTVNGVMMFIGAADEVKLWIDKYNKARTAFMNKYECPLKIPLNYFNQISEISQISDISQISSEPIGENILVNEEIDNNKRTDSDCISGYSTCTESIGKQISLDEGSLQNDDDCQLIQQFSSMKKYDFTNEE